MKTIALSQTSEIPENVVTLTIQPKPKPETRPQRFKITEFTNRAGSTSFRVAGYKPDGSRIRENFSDLNGAKVRQIGLESECLAQPTVTDIQATKLTPDQLRLAELAVLKLGEDWPKLVDAVDNFKRTGADKLPTDTPCMDDAIDQYLTWLDASPFRDATKRHWKTRMKILKGFRNIKVAEATPEYIEDFLATRNTSASGKDTDRRAISRFFSWCIERPRRWTTANPCREVKVEQGEKAPPAVLSVADCKAILKAAEAHCDGLLVPYAALCLFGGLRPAEVERLTWENINLKDGEICLDAKQTKTGRKSKKGRMVKISPTLGAWLKGRRNKPIYPANWRKEFDTVKRAAGFGTDSKPWPSDVLRHTAISHFFRQTGSYGFTAEQFGNSEAIIKAHYQGRVSSAETKAFYKLRP